MSTIHGAMESLIPLGQEAAWNRLVQMSVSLPQALIFLGPAGVGKRRAARALFQRLNCSSRSNCGHCIGCRRVLAAEHSDWIEISPQGDVITGEDLRETKRILHLKPLESPVRFVVIDEAHRLNPTSSNALLKTLEEPPAHTRFVLITYERGLLLPTITSRCQFVLFSPLSDAVLLEILRRLDIEIPDSIRGLGLKWMGGGVSRVDLFRDEKMVAIFERALRSVGSDTAPPPPSPPPWNAIARQADELSSVAGGLELFLDLLIVQAHTHAIGVASTEPSRRQAETVLKAAFLRRRLDRHANKKLVALATADLEARRVS